MSNEDDKKDGRGHSPGSFETRIKPGEKKNPKGRPKGAKGVIATLKKSMLNKMTLRENGVSKQLTVLEGMMMGTAKQIIGGNHHYLEFALEAIVHLSKLEQVQDYNAESRRHTDALVKEVMIYEAHENWLFEMTDEERNGLIRLVKQERKSQPMLPTEEIIKRLMERLDSNDKKKKP